MIMFTTTTKSFAQFAIVCACLLFSTTTADNNLEKQQQSDDVKSQFSEVISKYPEQPPLEKAGDTLPINISNTDKSEIEPKIQPNGAQIYILSKAGASFLTAHFKSFDLPKDCKVIISDKDGKQKDTMRKKGKAVWSSPVFGETLKLRLFCRNSEDVKKASFEVDQYSIGDSSVGDRMDRSICGRDNKQNAVCYKNLQAYEKAKAVAHLLFPKNGRWYVCTGWLASSSSLLLTNNHCLGTETQVRSAYFYFMKEESQCGVNSSGSRGVVYRASSLLKTNASLDYSLIQMYGNPAQTYGHLEIDTQRALVTGDRIYIPQHPGGRPKEIAIFDDQDTSGVCKVGFYWYSNTALFYKCDTEGGSSGSPVIAWNSNKVVGLHKWGGCSNGGASMYKVWQEIKQLFPSIPVGVKVAFKTAHNSYIRAEPGGYGAKVDQQAFIGAWEKFTIEAVGNGKFALKTVHGSYIRAEPGGFGAKVDQQTFIGAWEQFTIQPVDNGKVALKTAHGSYIRAEPGGYGAKVDQQTFIGAWEKFTIVLA